MEYLKDTCISIRGVAGDVIKIPVYSLEVLRVM